MTESQKEMSKSKSQFIKDSGPKEEHSINHIDDILEDVEESNDDGVPESVIVKSRDSEESSFAIQEENEIDIPIQTKLAFNCDQCEFTYKRKSHLKSHKLTKHKGVRFDCDRCEFRATTRNILRQHIQSIHEGIRYYCYLCEYTSTKRREVRVHKEAIHNDPTEKVVPPSSYECDLCESVLKTKRSLNDHMNYKHVGIKYPCDKCDFKAARKSNLRCHNLSKHSNEKLTCDQCSFQTFLPRQLELHKLSTHEGVRYNCGQCDYKTVLESRLRAHKKSRHEGITEIPAKVPAICDEWRVKQSDVGTLRKHMKQMHEGKL